MEITRECDLWNSTCCILALFLLKKSRVRYGSTWDWGIPLICFCITSTPSQSPGTTLCPQVFKRTSVYLRIVSQCAKNIRAMSMRHLSLNNVKNKMVVQHEKGNINGFLLLLGRWLCSVLWSYTSYNLGALEDVNRKNIVSIDLVS